jgi:hypothetical protein
MAFFELHEIGAKAPRQTISGLFANRVFGVEVLSMIPGLSLNLRNPPTDAILAVSFLPRLQDHIQGDVGVAPQIFQVFHEFFIVLIAGMKN